MSPCFYGSGLLFMQTKQCWPSSNLKNKSLIFSRWDDLISHESQRKAENWTTGSGMEIKLAVHPLLFHHLHRAPGMCFLPKPDETVRAGEGECDILIVLSLL